MMKKTQRATSVRSMYNEAAIAAEAYGLTDEAFVSFVTGWLVSAVSQELSRLGEYDVANSVSRLTTR